jgi:hypothetical protein
MKFRTSVKGLAAATVIASISATLPVVLAPPAVAQANPALSNLVPESASVTFAARIKSIDPATRDVVLVGRSGTEISLTAGPAVRLDLLKPGDRVRGKYYRSVAFLISGAQSNGGTAPSAEQITQLVAEPASVPGGVGVRLTKVSGLVVGIDMAAHSVDVVSPGGGGVYTIDVTNPARIAALSQLKVGDTVTAVVSEAVAVDIEPAPASWF